MFTITLEVHQKLYIYKLKSVPNYFQEVVVDLY